MAVGLMQQFSEADEYEQN